MTHRYHDGDAGACYACGRTWEPGEGERHRPGCYRILDPVGRPEPGTCFECGAREYPDGACSNEGQCRRWRDPAADLHDDGDEPPAYSELVAAARERKLDELP
jgi:hypothetical protein